MTLNYQSPKEKKLLANTILADKNQLPKFLRNFDKPLYLIFTENYKIRIDKKQNAVLILKMVYCLPINLVFK